MASREDCFVDALFKVLGVFEIFAEKDETSTRATKGFMTANSVSENSKTKMAMIDLRSGRNNITIVEWTVELLSSNETASVGHVAQ